MRKIILGASLLVAGTLSPFDIADASVNKTIKHLGQSAFNKVAKRRAREIEEIEIGNAKKNSVDHASQKASVKVTKFDVGVFGSAFNVLAEDVFVRKLAQLLTVRSSAVSVAGFASLGNISLKNVKAEKVEQKLSIKAPQGIEAGPLSKIFNLDLKNFHGQTITQNGEFSIQGGAFSAGAKVGNIGFE